MGRRRTGGGGGISATGQAARFLGVSVLSGAVLAGLALPAVGLFGLAARGSMEGFEDIPDAMLTPPLSQTSTILDSEGNEIAEVYSRNRTVVELDDMSELLQQAIVAIEDARFYEHGAVDLEGTLRALTRNVSLGEIAEGGSTLTQQYVKNVFVEQAGDDPEAVAEATRQTVGRKIAEIKYAIELEQELTKDQILENYLNITYFGAQAYGIEAASQRFFSKPAADLELHEAAMLAGLVQSPSQYDPLINSEAARDRRDTVLQAMADNDAISQREADEAMSRDLGLDVSEPRNGCITAVADAGFFCDYVRHEFLSNPAFGETREDRWEVWALGGLTIHTTLDPQAQVAAVQAAEDNVNADDTVAAAVTQVEPGSGHILSMAQSRPYGNDATQNQTVLNLNVGADAGGSTNGFQPGSTFKAFTAAAALEAGISPAQTYTTDYELTVPMSDFQDCEGRPVGDADWDVQNEREDEAGTWDMSSALAESINTYFVELEREVGLCETITMAGDLGIRHGSGEPLSAHPSATLGGQETTPLMMAAAYATFANRGTYCEPVAITGVANAEGEQLPVPDSECRQVMSQHTADTVTQMLTGVLSEGTGQSVNLTDRAAAGKTGTTDDRADVWFVGFTPEITTAVHVGSDAEPMPLTNLTIGGVYYDAASGAGVAGPIWNQAMSGALSGVAPSSFVEVDVPRGGGPGAAGQPGVTDQPGAADQPGGVAPGDVEEGENLPGLDWDEQGDWDFFGD